MGVGVEVGWSVLAMTLVADEQWGGGVGEVSSVSKKAFGGVDSLVKSRVEAGDYVHVFKITLSDFGRTESESLVSCSGRVCQWLLGHFGLRL